MTGHFLLIRVLSLSFVFKCVKLEVKAKRERQILKASGAPLVQTREKINTNIC